MQAPQILTQPELTQRSSQPVCMIQSEEILRVRTPAYSRTNADLSFLIRQPSASAILVNDVELVLECQFTIAGGTHTVHAKYQTGSTGVNNTKYQPLDNAAIDYGFMPQMLPIQNKCIRNAVMTINGSSQSHRANEYGVEYCLLHGSRGYMNKIGGGINEYKKPMIMSLNKQVAAAPRFYAETDTRCMQNEKWVAQFMQDKADVDGQVAGSATTPTFQFKEKLYMGAFGAFQQAESFPAWSVEGAKSPGLLHVHNLQLSFAMEDQWWNSMFLAVENNSGGNNFVGLQSVTISKAEIHTRWVLPPPRMLSAAISQSVSYSTFDVLRFVADAQSNPGLKEDGDQNFTYKLNAVSFPYMPQLFVFSVCPQYGFATNLCGSGFSAGGALEQMKMDKRVTISHIDLQINTSSAAIPFAGEGGQQAARINAADLYRMTLENCASIENFPHTFEEWYYNCCVVAVTPAQLSGVLNSPNVRGGVTLQGTIHCKNLTGHPINTGAGNVTYTGSGNPAVDRFTFEHLANVPRYRCLVSGFYCNRSLVLDAKSGLLQESTYSPAFQSGLRSGTGGA